MKADESWPDVIEAHIVDDDGNLVRIDRVSRPDLCMRYFSEHNWGRWHDAPKNKTGPFPSMICWRCGEVGGMIARGKAS